MAFFGESFIFDGVSCEEFDLMLYDTSTEQHSDGRFAIGAEAVESDLATRRKQHLYGIRYGEKLTFDIVFGVNQHRIDDENYLDRYELEAIAGWLTGHNGYKWLEIVQQDMEHVRYKCMVSGLEIIEYGQIPWALKAKITCDGPYGYRYQNEYTYDIENERVILFCNESNTNEPYRPLIRFELKGGNGFSIQNTNCNGDVFEIANLPDSVRNISIDCDSMVIQSDQDINIYDYCNFQFPCLVKGINRLIVRGNGTLRILCDFPVNIGG